MAAMLRILVLILALVATLPAAAKVRVGMRGGTLF